MADNTKIRYIYQFIIGRWQTTLKLATKREYIAQWCYCSLFKFTRSNGWELKLLDILMNIVIMSETIKKLTDAPSQVLAILQKDNDNAIYSEVKHVAKGVNLNNIVLPEEINAMINLDNYRYKGK